LEGFDINGVALMRSVSRGRLMPLNHVIRCSIFIWFKSSASLNASVALVVEVTAAGQSNEACTSLLSGASLSSGL